MTILLCLVAFFLLLLLSGAAFAVSTRHRIPVLMYHRIGDVPGDRNTMTREQFVRELEYLAHRKYRTILPHELLAAARGETRLRRRSVLLTFDDASRDTFSIVLPELKKRGFSACVFPIANLAESGKPYTGGKAPADVMRVEELKTWLASGMAVGSHTLTHAPLGRIEPELMEKEVADSRKKLESLLGTTIDVLCYPYGSFSPAVETAAREAGYVMAFAIVEDVPLCGFSPFAIPRIGSSARQSPAEFRLKVSPLFRFMVFFRSLEGVVKKWKRRTLSR